MSEHGRVRTKCKYSSKNIQLLDASSSSEVSQSSYL